MSQDNHSAEDDLEPIDDDELEKDAPDHETSEIEILPPEEGSLARDNLPNGYSRESMEKVRQKKKEQSRDKQATFMEHIGELRNRILYSVYCVCIATIITWQFGDDISAFLARPILKSLKAYNVKFQLITIAPAEGLLVYFQIVLASAIIVSMPFIMWQFWRFIEPALSNRERRFTTILVPFSVVLFVAGCALGYYVSPLFFNFFLAFQPPGSVANLSYGSSVALLAKMLLVFGVCFQVPVIVIFLNRIGLVSQDVLKKYWRHVVVGIVFVVAVLTPTWDPITLIVCSGPPIVLYFVAIWMIKWL